MGDEPYAALLPWAVFAVVDRAGADPLWAGIGALITAVTLLVTSTRPSAGGRNVILLGAVVWFSAIAIAGGVHPTNAGILAHDGRAISAAGFALIAFGSLIFTPAMEHYTRPHVRTKQWDDRAFRRLNVLLTLVWAATFTGISLSHFVGASMNTPEAFTVFNYVIPIALVAIAAHRSRVSWDDFNDDDMYEPDPISDLELDWEPPLHSDH